MVFPRWGRRTSQVQLYKVVTKGTGPGISLQLPLLHLAVSQIVAPPPVATSAHAMSTDRSSATTATGILTCTGTTILRSSRGAPASAGGGGHAPSAAAANGEEAGGGRAQGGGSSERPPGRRR